MPVIESIVLRCLHPQAQCTFYCNLLGMQNFGDSTVGYGAPQASLKFIQAGGPYVSTSHNRYWKIALAVPDIELACRHLANHGIIVSEPDQFKDIGYLAHFKDPEGFTIELIDHAFKGERSELAIDDSVFGGGAHLNLLTLRTATIENARETCLSLGMTALSVQPVEGYAFTLHFFAFTDEVPPNPDLQAIENRPWLYQRPYTVLEFQHLHDATSIEVGDPDCAGYSGFCVSDSNASRRMISSDYIL